MRYRVIDQNVLNYYLWHFYVIVVSIVKTTAGRMQIVAAVSLHVYVVVTVQPLPRCRAEQMQMDSNSYFSPKFNFFSEYFVKFY